MVAVLGIGKSNKTPLLTNRQWIAMRRQHRDPLLGSGRFLLSKPVNSGKVRKLGRSIIVDRRACCLSAEGKNCPFIQHFNFDRFRVTLLLEIAHQANGKRPFAIRILTSRRRRR